MRGVLAADDARPDHGQRPRDAVHVEDRVGVVEALGSRTARPSARSGGSRWRSGSPAAREAVLAAVHAGDRARCAGPRSGPSPRETRRVAVEVGLDHVLQAAARRASSRYMNSGTVSLARQGVVDPVEAALAQAGEVERGLAQGLAREGAGVDAGAAEEPPALDEGDALAEVGGLGRALLARPGRSRSRSGRNRRRFSPLRRTREPPRARGPIRRPTGKVAAF